MVSALLFQIVTPDQFEVRDYLGTFRLILSWRRR